MGSWSEVHGERPQELTLLSAHPEVSLPRQGSGRPYLQRALLGWHQVAASGSQLLPGRWGMLRA